MKAASLIVVGTPFSGATLLGHALGAHSQAFFAGELWRQWDRATAPGERRCRTCADACAIWNDPAVAAALAAGPAAVSAALAATTGRRLVIEGPAPASWLAERLACGESVREDTRIVLCVCDPLFYVRRRGGVTEEYARCRAAEWRDQQNTLLGAARSSGRPLLVMRREDLADRPEDTLARVCGFAGLEYEPALVEPPQAPTHALGAASEAWGVAEPPGANPAASGDARPCRAGTRGAPDHDAGPALDADVAHAVIAELRPTGLGEIFGYEPALPPRRAPRDDAGRQHTAAWAKDDLRCVREAVLDGRADLAISTLRLLVDHFGPAFDELGLEAKYENLALVLVDLLNHRQREAEALPYARALVEHAPHDPEARRLLTVASGRLDDAPATPATAPPSPPPGTLDPQEADLSWLAAKFMTDKEHAHHYAQHYQRHFESLRWRPLNILEIGVGGYDNPREGGASLRMWKAYFPNSRIFGIDLYDKTCHDEPRIKTFQGSQIDEAFLRRVAEEIGPIDIVIDDGSHLNDHVIKTFKILFPLMSPDGIYVAEDLQTSYWDTVEGQVWGGSPDLQAPHTSMNFFKGLVDCLNHEEFTVEGYVPSYWDEHIISMQFCHNLVFVQKGLNIEGSNVLGRAGAARAVQPREEAVDSRCRWLNIELSSACNLRCRWCILDHDKPRQFLPLDTLERILQQISRGELPDLERIDLHNGGEALLHPGIDDALRLLARYRPAFPRSVHVALLTNGTVLRENTLALLASGDTVDEIRVSVDGGTPEDYERIRTNAKWATVSRNVQRISTALKDVRRGTTLGIICMVAPDRPLDVAWMDPEFTAVLRLADSLELRHPHTWEGSLRGIDGLAADTARKQKNRVCMFLKRNLVVMANGDVSICCADLNGRGTIGSIGGQGLSEIANGANRQHLVTLWRQGRFDELPACSGCQGHYDPLPTDEAPPSPPRETDARALEGMTLAQLEDVARREPNNRAARNDLGVLYCQRGDPERALEHFTAAVAGGDTDPVAWKNLASLHEMLGHFDEAVDSYERVVRQQPDDVDALSGLGRLCIEADRIDSARFFFRRVLEIDPASADARAILDSLADREAQGPAAGSADGFEPAPHEPAAGRAGGKKSMACGAGPRAPRPAPSEADTMVADFPQIQAWLHPGTGQAAAAALPADGSLEVLQERIQPLVDQGLYSQALKECLSEFVRDHDDPRRILQLARLHHRAGCMQQAASLFECAAARADGDRGILRRAEMFAWASRHLPTSRTDIENFCDPDVILVQAPGWGVNTPPLGTAMLTSFARSRGYKVLPVDLNVEFYLRRPQEFDRTWELEQSLCFWNTAHSVERMLHVFRETIDAFVEMVVASNARVVGFTLYDSSAHISLELARRLKRARPGILVVFGGPHASRFAVGPTFIQESAVDAVAQGEGEGTLVDILERVRAGRTLADCPGLLVRGDDGTVNTGDRAVITDLDRLPPPDFSDYAFERYRTPTKLPVSSSRGCLNRCIFCNERPFWKKYRYRSAQNVFAEIQAQMARYPAVNFVEFQDSVVNGVIRELERLTDLIHESGLKFNWSGQAVIRKEMTPELMAKLKRSGCVCLAYGLENPSSALMLSVGKVVSRGADVDAIAAAHARTGLGVTYNFMFGLPGETEEDAFAALEFLRRNSKHGIAVNPSSGFCEFRPGTLAREDPQAYGLDLSRGSTYWESTDGQNTYIRRLKRFEDFCRLVRELNIPTTYPSTVLLDRDRALGHYYLQAGDHERARSYFAAWLAEHPEDDAIRAALEEASHPGSLEPAHAATGTSPRSDESGAGPSLCAVAEGGGLTAAA